MTTLSGGARRLYRQLLDLGPVPVDDTSIDGPDDERLVSLMLLGLVYENDERYYAVAPPAARSRVLVGLGRRSRDLLQQGLDTDAFLASFPVDVQMNAATSTGTSAVEVVTGTQVIMLSNTLLREARREVRSVNTASLRSGDHRHYRSGPIESDLEAGIVYRVIYARDLAYRGREGPHRMVFFEGEEARVHPAPVLKFKVVDDDTALVPLDETGEGGALLVRSRPFCRLLIDYFERLWVESTPLDGSAPAPESILITPVQVRILQMLADDRSDPAIVQRLGISDRTLRRHLTAILDRLGVTTRTGALGVAARHGWLDPAAAAATADGVTEVAP